MRNTKLKVNNIEIQYNRTKYTAVHPEVNKSHHRYVTFSCHVDMNVMYFRLLVLLVYRINNALYVLFLIK